MSGPLQSLKKTKRAPLMPISSKDIDKNVTPEPENRRENLGRSQRIVPFRNAPKQATGEKSINAPERATEADMYAAEMNKKFGEFLHKEVINSVNKEQSSKHHVSDDNNNTGSDEELLSMMMKRLTQVEKKLVLSRLENANKDDKIKELEFQVSQLQLQAASSAQGSDYEQLKHTCRKLQKQLHEMERFLNDYGLIWVGEQSDSSDNEDDDNTNSSDMWKPDDSVAKPLEMDFTRLIENITELNVIANAGNPTIVKTVAGAAFQLPDAIPLTIYKNGFAMYDGPFRHYDDPIAKQFILDIYDGYFPSELQAKYPDGIPFQINDCREVYYKNKRLEHFPGVGQILGVQAKIDQSGKNEDSNASPVNVTSQLSKSKPQSVDKFVSKLPEAVIRDGKVISIRSEVAAQMQVSDESKTKVVLVETDPIKKMKEMHSNNHEKPSTPTDVTTLRVKNEHGNKVYIVKLKFDDTVGDLYNAIRKQRPPNSAAFKIHSSFPKMVYTNKAATLFDSGLTPNATLHLRANKT